MSGFHLHTFYLRSIPEIRKQVKPPIRPFAHWPIGSFVNFYIGAVIISALFTLFVIPVVYTFMDRFARKPERVEEGIGVDELPAMSAADPSTEVSQRHLSTKVQALVVLFNNQIVKEVTMKPDKRDQRRKEILEAACRVFAQKGYYTATVSDIANEAGIAQGTMYIYFKSKEDLLMAIFSEGMRVLIDYVKEETRKVSGAEAKLKRLIEVHIRAYDQYRDLAQLVLIELRQAGKFLQSDALEPTFEYLTVIKGILDEGIKEGVFDASLDTEFAATMLYSTIDGVATRWVLEDFSYSLIEAAETINRIFFQGICVKENECTPD